jgi:hypothetical protein
MTTGSAYCSFTNSAANPCPPPTHIEHAKILPPVCFPIAIPVATCLAPVAPKGCPIAIAPPLRLTFSKSMPNFLIE